MLTLTYTGNCGNEPCAQPLCSTGQQKPALPDSPPRFYRPHGRAPASARHIAQVQRKLEVGGCAKTPPTSASSTKSQAPRERTHVRTKTPPTSESPSLSLSQPHNPPTAPPRSLRNNANALARPRHQTSNGCAAATFLPWRESNTCSTCPMATRRAKNTRRNPRQLQNSTS